MKQIWGTAAFAWACTVWVVASLAGCGGWTSEQDASAPGDAAAEAAQAAATGPVSPAAAAVAPVVAVAVAPTPAVAASSPTAASVNAAASAPATAASAPVAPTPVAAPAAAAPPTFQSQVMARPATQATDASTTPTLSAADARQVARLSREWAVPALWQQGTTAWTNGVVLPPLQFAWMQGVASAARGPSLAQLQAVWPAANAPPAVGAALMRGVARTVSGKPESTVIDSFVSAVALDAVPGTLASFTLQALSTGAMAADPLLRLDIADTISGSPSWVQPAGFSGHFYSTSQGSLIVPMLRVVGMVLTQAGSTYEAKGLHLGGGRWLFRITPGQGLNEFGALGLDSALTALGAAMAASVARQAVTGDMVVPATAFFPGYAVDDLSGLIHALDRVNADMRGLDGAGGTSLRADPAYGSMTFNDQGFSYNASRSAKFVFEPLNTFNSSGVINTRVNPSFGLPPPCPSPTPDLRPSYFVLMDGNGRIELLARMARLEGVRCQ